MIDTRPETRALYDNDPMLREAMSNMDFVREMMKPETMKVSEDYFVFWDDVQDLDAAPWRAKYAIVLITKSLWSNEQSALIEYFDLI